MNNGILKIGDLGFAKQVAQLEFAKTCLGTALYMAPEVLNFKPYNNKADIWSLAVVFYEMIFGSFPFDAKTEKQLLNAINKRNIDFNKNKVNISDECRDLISKMLQPDPKVRIDWVNLYEHPLLEKYEKNIKEENLLMSISQPLNFRDLNKFERKITMDKNKDFYKNVDGKKENQIELKEEVKEEELDNYLEEISENENNLKGVYYEIEKDEKIQEYIKIIIFRKNVYGLLGKALQSTQVFSEDPRDFVVNFVLSKKLMNLNIKLMEILNEKKNIDNFKFFNEFIKSKDFQSLLRIIKDENDIYKTFFDVHLVDTQNIVNQMKSKNKWFSDLKILNNLKKEIEPEFFKLYEGVLIDYIYRLINKTENFKKNEDFVKRIFIHCSEIVDCIKIDELTFEKNKKMDFSEHQIKLNFLTIVEIKQDIDERIKKILN